MNTHAKPASISRRSTPIPGARAIPFVAACLATLLALPVNAAVVFPDNPLQTGSAYPPPNVMFILDDSGSMAFDFMPGSNSSSEVPKTSPVEIQLQAYPRNTLYYNPDIVYRAWLTGDTAGTRFTGGTSYTNVYTSDTALSGSLDLSNATQTMYVPKDGATDMAATASYWRYQIVKGGADIVRSEYGTGGPGSGNAPGFPKSGLAAGTGQSGQFVYQYSIVLPANATSVTATTSGGSDGGNGVDLYLRLNAIPTTGTYDCRSQGNKNAENCTVNGSAGDTMYVYLRNGNNSSGQSFSNVQLGVTISTNARCDGGGSSGNTWINCTSATPIVHNGDGTTTQRSIANEKINFATWYSYYRTRSKMAKGSASEAFGQMGSNLRVGFDTIWNRDKNGNGINTGGSNPSYSIPVGTSDGKFTGTNRTDWFSRLQGAIANNGTPLKGALQRAGRYYQSKGNSDPWQGPGTGSDRISCRQSFTILTTDGYWNDDSGYDGKVDDADDTDGSVITAKDGKTTGQYKAVPPYSDKNGHKNSVASFDTLADIANYYWKQDLNSLDNDVPSSDADPAFWQHMTTFSLAIGQSGTLDPDTDLVSIKNGSKYWPAPSADKPSTIDDLWHAAVNGHGNFVAASNPTKFAQALVDALATVAARTGSASNVTANSTSFQSDTAVYQASYVSGKWTGELASYAVSSAGVAATPTWQASKKIPAYPNRTIVTWDTTLNAGLGGGASFPTSAQTSGLARTIGLAPVTAADNANYLKGEQKNEKQKDGLLRDRIQTVLGDIADSSPLFIKENATNKQTIFVGANDGMLHAFEASTGAELFAYIPAGLDLANLASLSDPQYVHKWFVDGPIVVSTQAQTTGANYLVGALGRGGKGLFGLDVTDPTAFTAAKVKWDKTGSEAPADMGQVLGEPLIVKFNDGTTGLIVSNGLNSSTGTAALFIMDIATGTVVREIDTTVTGGNGLSAPRGWDNDGNGTVDYVYAGDLKGNLWKFDLTASVNTGWTIANGGKAMFTAKDATNKAQPITTGLGLARDPATGKRWIFIGTGSFMSTGDVTDMSVQSMYGIIDDDTIVKGRTSAGDGDLQKREIVLIDGTEKYRGFEPHGTLDPSKKGWYIDLLTPPSPGTAEGERIVNRPLIRGTVLITASMIPPTGETCEAGGRGYINAIDAFTGTSTNEPYFDTNGNGDFTDDTIGSGSSEVPIGSVDLGVGMPTLPTIIDNLLVVGGSTGAMGQIKVNPQGAGARRISWREILRD